MKHRSITIALGLVVLTIWAAVLRRVVSDPKTVDMPEGDGPQTIGASFFRLDTLPPTVTLGNYRDPFLGGTVAEPTAGTITPRKDVDAKPPEAVPRLQPVVAAPAPWPAIAFQGSVKRGSGERGVALLNVNGTKLLLASGGEAQGLRLVSVARDSVVLALGAERRTYKR